MTWQPQMMALGQDPQAAQPFRYEMPHMSQLQVPQLQYDAFKTPSTDLSERDEVEQSEQRPRLTTMLHDDCGDVVPQRGQPMSKLGRVPSLRVKSARACPRDLWKRCS